MTEHPSSRPQRQRRSLILPVLTTMFVLSMLDTLSLAPLDCQSSQAILSSSTTAEDGSYSEIAASAAAIIPTPATETKDSVANDDVRGTTGLTAANDNRSAVIASILSNAGMAPPPNDRNETFIERATSKYRARIRQDIMPKAKQRDDACRAVYRSLSLAKAKDCLHDDSVLRYPLDAEAHFNEIRAALAPWAQHDGSGYRTYAQHGGPWIANHFVAHQERRYENMVDRARNVDWCLSDVFGPYIPILIPWTDVWKKNGFEYPFDLVKALNRALRPNVPYLVLVENDRGWSQGTPYFTNDYARAHDWTVTVLSSGGYGHVPVPLQIGKLTANKTAVKDRKLLTTYVGKVQNAPHRMRQRMHKIMTTVNENRGGKVYKHHYGPGWIEAMMDARFNFVPRGFGRTAFHLVEVLQLGLVPIFVYSDIAWLPYGDLLTRGEKPLAYAVRVTELRHLVKRVLPKIRIADIEDREARILKLYQSHFSNEGIMAQIDHFLLQDGRSDLACRALPRTVRDEK